MLQRHPTQPRRGAIAVFVALSVTALMSMIALAIDIGLIALARNQAQNAADAAALASVRQLNGDVANNNNLAQVQPAAEGVATSNAILGSPITTSQVQADVGYYSYDDLTQSFEPIFTGTKPAEENWGAVQVTVTASKPTFFAKVFGVSSFNTSATAIAVHRPRDIAIVLDFSGSMHFSSEVAHPTNGDIDGSLNPDPRYPKFGHWTTMANVLQKTTLVVDGGGETHAPNNLTIETENGPAIVEDFLMRNGANTLVPAFNRAGSPYDAMTAATPAPANFDVQSDSPAPYVGDKWPRLSDDPGQTFAATVQEFLHGNNNTLANDHEKDTAFEPADASSPTADEGFGSEFKGYAMGPGYYGKTFYHWPPDPRFHPTDTDLQLDWRKKFFYYTGTSTPMDDNSRLWESDGDWRQAKQSNSYDINYNAVIQWITSGPQVFPPNLRAGRVLYYTEIPNTIPSSGGTMDQRFWREYIDHVIGAGSATEQRRTLYGGETGGWGSVKITPKSSLNADPDLQPYLHYNDNPRRPRLHFWFGPLSMLDFFSETNNNYRNWLPGTAHEAQTWQLKVGIQSALNDIEKNHPNDWASTIYFSHLNQFNTERVAMGRSYGRMKNALFYPFSLLDDLGEDDAEIRPYNNSFNSSVSDGELPNGHGGTSPEMGLKLAYNQFSSSPAFNGRRGAAKMVIFETDGVPNTTGLGSFTNAGPYNSYYSSVARGDSLGNNNSTVVNRTLDVVARIAALDTATEPGYSTPKRKARVHALAFGDLFQSGSFKKQQALDFLLDVQKNGNTSAQSASSIESYKIITGNYNTRISNLRTAMERIMQSGVQVSLIR